MVRKDRIGRKGDDNVLYIRKSFLAYKFKLRREYDFGKLFSGVGLLIEIQSK